MQYTISDTETRQILATGVEGTDAYNALLRLVGQKMAPAWCIRINPEQRGDFFRVESEKTGRVFVVQVYPTPRRFSQPFFFPKLGKVMHMETVLGYSVEDAEDILLDKALALDADAKVYGIVKEMALDS